MRNDAAFTVNGRVEAECNHCGAWFYGERVTGFFCSSACRVAFHRAQKARARDIEQLVKYADKVLANMPRRGDSDEFVALQKLETLIHNTLREVEAK